MALAPAIHGALRPGQTITWVREDGQPEDLTGATLTGTLYRRMLSEQRAITGILTIVDAINGVFRWEYDLADVIAGTYLVTKKF